MFVSYMEDESGENRNLVEVKVLPLKCDFNAAANKQVLDCKLEWGIFYHY